MTIDMYLMFKLIDIICVHKLSIAFYLIIYKKRTWKKFTK